MRSDSGARRSRKEQELGIAGTAAPAQPRGIPIPSATKALPSCAGPTQDRPLWLPSSSPSLIRGCKQRICWTKPQPPVSIIHANALSFTTQVPSQMLQPSGAASWEAGSGLHEKASYLLRNCLCGILTIWKEYGNETFSKMELLS